MSSYIKQAACNGRRPSHLGKLHCIQRPELVALLLRDRRRPRFVFAPPGYGKSFLALDYCDTVFGFSHVFWLRGTSPCFLRDLDAEAIASGIKAVDAAASLAVFDDVPLMDAERIEKLRGQIAYLLNSGCEVIVMGSPSIAACADSFDDRVVMHAVDLLLSDRELSVLRGAPALSGNMPNSEGGHIVRADSALASSMRTTSAATRIPALAWSSSPEQLDAFLAGLFNEEFEMHRAAAILYMMMVGTGDAAAISGAASGAVAVAGDAAVSGAAAAGAPGDTAAWLAELARDYPHLGIDEMAERFDCSSFPVDGVVAAARAVARRVATALYNSRSDDMVMSWADIAYEQGLFERACDIVRLMMTCRMRGTWTASHAYGLIRSGAFLPAYRLVASVAEPSADIRPQLTVLELACRLHLQDGTQAILQVRRFAFSATAAPGFRLVCLAALARYGNATLAERALCEIREIIDNDSDDGLAEPACALMLARGALAMDSGPARLADLLAYECAQPALQDGDALCILAAWLFDDLAGNAEIVGGDSAELRGRQEHRGEQPANSRLAAALDGIASFVCDRMAHARPLEGDSFAVAAGLALEHARMSRAVDVQVRFRASAMLALRDAETSVLGQRMRFELDESRSRDLHVDHLETHPDVMYAASLREGAPVVVKRPPVLRVRLFGRLETTIGDIPVDDRLISRRKVRKLLVMLAVNCGHELARDAICGQLWPSSTLDVARKNFYNVFSTLRRALSLPDGTCPYLIRRRMSCALDARMVATDVMRLDAICREFLFGQPDEMAWGELISEVDRDFCTGIVPEEVDDSYIEGVRTSLDTRLVDALSAGARRITQMGSPECGIWLARAAISRDRTREDAYIALMTAQDAARQRPAALLTFQDMRHALSDELGVDPSPEAQRLYERILMADGGTAAAC